MGNREISKKLHDSSMGMIQRKMVRKVLENLGGLSLTLGAMPHQMKINITFKKGEEVEIIITTQINANYLDVTSSAQDMAEHHEGFVNLVTDIKDVIKKAADFWCTPTENVVFKAWLVGEMENNTLKCILQPKIGFPRSEYLDLTK